MKRTVVGGILAALIYPLVNFVNGFFGAACVPISPILVFLSLTAGVITLVFFGKLLVSQRWRQEKNLGYRFAHLLFAMLKVTAVFAVLIIFIIAGDVLLGAALPKYVFVIVRALSTVAGMSSLVSMVLVCWLMQEPVSKPAPVLQK